MDSLKSNWNKMKGGGGSGRSASERAQYPATKVEPSQRKAVLPPFFGGMEYVQAMELPELVEFARKLSGVTPSLKKFPKAGGMFYHINKGLIKLHPELFKDPEAGAQIMAHEIGHNIDWLPEGLMGRGNLIGRLISSVNKYMRNTLGDQVNNKEIRAELLALTKWWHPYDPEAVPESYRKYRESAKELYAEFLSVLLNSPVKAQEIAPKFYDAFFQYLDSKPEVLDALLKLQELIQGNVDSLYKHRLENIHNMFLKSDQMFRARQLRYKQARKSFWYQMKRLFFDENVAILDKRNQIAGQIPIDPESDPKYLLEENSYIGSFIKSYLEEFDKTYQQILEGGFENDVGTQLFLERIAAGDRQEIANPLGQTPQTAQKQMDWLRDNDPERYAKVDALVQEVRDWYKQINQLMGEDIFNQRQKETVAGNEKYAPFRVLKHMEEFVNAGMIHQVGTLSDISSPLTALILKSVSMLRAYERNRIKKQVGNFMLENGFEMREAKVTATPTSFMVEKSKDPLLRGQITWKEGGRWKGYHIDQGIADLFDGEKTGALGVFGNILDKMLMNNALFRPIFITFNIGFQMANFIRDLKRFWKNTPGLTLAGALKAYGESLPTAVRRVKGEWDDAINEMERNKALNITYNDLILGQTDEDKELDKVLERFDLIEKKELKWANIPVVKQIIQFMDGIRFVGDVIETLPKVAGWRSLPDDMSNTEKAYYVRNLIGTPNPKRKGALKAITNSVFLFSNIIKEGYRGMFEAGFTNPRTRGGYWKKTVMADIFPKLMMWLGALGVFGAGVKKIMDSQSEYTKSQYTVIPLGTAENGDGVALSIPSDEDGRFISAIFWKLLNGTQDPLKMVQDIFSFTGGQLPNLSPGISTPAAWWAFLNGQNPVDAFRGRNIIPQEAFKAGGMKAFTPMVKWTANQMGLTRFDVYDNNQPLYKKLLALTPGVNRFIRVTNYGQTEKYRDASQRVAKQEATGRLDIKERIKKGEAVIPETKRQKSQFQRQALREEAYQSNQPATKALLSATSNNQKMTILDLARSEYKTRNEYRDYLISLIRTKVISKEVAKNALRNYK